MVRSEHGPSSRISQLTGYISTLLLPSSHSQSSPAYNWQFSSHHNSERPGGKPRSDPKRPKDNFRPDTKSPGGKPRPDTKRPKDNFRPDTKSPGGKPRPDTKRPKDNFRPDTKSPGGKPRPDTKRPKDNFRPDTKSPGGKPRPDTKRPGDKPRPHHIIYSTISIILIISCLLFCSCRMDSHKDEPTSVETLRDYQLTITGEVQEIRDDLLERMEDPDYNKLEYKWLDDIENRLASYEKAGYSHKSQLRNQETDEDARKEDLKNWKILKELVTQTTAVCRRLLSIREIHAKIQSADRILTQLRAKRLEHPLKDYSAPVKRIAERMSEISEILDLSTIPPDHKIRARMMELEINLEDMEIVDVIPAPDTKERIKDQPQPPKIQAIAPPTFNGLQRDWQSFWAAFRDIHECSKYSAAAKLSYLRQAQKDTSLYNQLCQNVANGDSYDQVVAGLQDQFDRPREDHRIYIENITKMQPVKPTRSSLMTCATTMQSTLDGLARLKQEDIQSILTTLIEPLLPEKIKSQWEEATVDQKKVPTAKELIMFLRKRASMPQFADKTSSHPAPEKKQFKQQSRLKGSVHVASSSPAQSQSTPQPQPIESKSTTSSPQPSSKVNSSSKSKPMTYLPIRYCCPLCKENHYAWACSLFKEKPLNQRRDYVQQNSLCNNCLKPGHSQADCKSRFSCQTCQGRHNTLLHSGNNSPAAVGTVNHIINNTSDSLHQAKLLMTCKVLVTGPTGNSMPVRALLDSGADVSSITTKVAKHLKLKNLKNTVSVATFGSNTETICNSTTFSLSSLLKRDWNHQVSAVVVDKITSDHPRQDASMVKTLPGMKDLIPADPLFHRPGWIDVLLGADVLPYVQSSSENPSSIIAVKTVFGHAFMGTYQPTPATISSDASIHLVKETSSPANLKSLIQQVARFWETENPLLMTSPHSPEEIRILEEYSQTHQYIESAGKYQVILPRRLEERQLGESKTQALQRYYQNERSQQRKGTLPEYQAVVQEYLDLKHARLYTTEELLLPSSVSYVLPMHGVTKISSSTTKLRVVFDRSSVTTSGWSLNDTLSAGPMLHPKLSEILIRFRKYRVALSGDISKMYREILLAPSEQQFHRFWWRPTLEEPVKLYCMDRVTFGVTCSPFLAVRTMQQAASDFGKDYPNAQLHINKSFYVDDLLGGADTTSEAITLYSEISNILKKGGFTLRKYRSNSQQVLDAIPKELVEAMPTKEMVDCHSDSYPKALGLIWNSEDDTMCTDVSYTGEIARTKKGILSDTSKTFDILGWITPAILPMKILFQDLWQLKVGWDNPLPPSYLEQHQTWRNELPLLSDIQLPRPYFLKEETTSVQLHGFSDASEKAYGAVIYIRATYANQNPTCRLVTAKSKVAPLKKRTIPELELSGAVLLADMLENISSILDIPKSEVVAWTDSTIVICWLRNSPSRYKTYVGNQISAATTHFSPSIWHHVPTHDNPADCASRGLSAGELRDKKLWWEGPLWLGEEPLVFPKQPHQSVLEENKDLDAKSNYCLITTATPTVWLADRLSSFSTLTKVTAWIQRAAYNFLSPIKFHPINQDKYLTVEEIR